MSGALEAATRDHFTSRFPGSSHYSPKKVNAQPGEKLADGAIGKADVDVPGASRAYHDITIRPVNRKFITIPLHQAAYGKKASDISGMFVLTSKAGKKFLAKKQGSAITLLWLLAKQAFQPQDSTIMPSDESLASSLLAKVAAEVKSETR